MVYLSAESHPSNY